MCRDPSSCGQEYKDEGGTSEVKGYLNTMVCQLTCDIIVSLLIIRLTSLSNPTTHLSRRKLKKQCYSNTLHTGEISYTYIFVKFESLGTND